MTLPAVVLVLALGLGALAAAGTAVRLQDTASDVARILGRGEGMDRADAYIAQTMPGAGLHARWQRGLVCVELSASTGPPLELTMSATASALDGGR